MNNEFNAESICFLNVNIAHLKVQVVFTYL